MIKQTSKIALVICIVFFKINNTCSQEAVQVAQEHFDKFNSADGGWLASDVTISLLLPDGKTLWLFGDCFIGEKSGEFGINSSTASLINNAAIIEDGDLLTTYHGGTNENPSSLIPAQNGDIFWPEHATIENDTIKIFAIQIIFKDNGTPGFNFRVGRTHLAHFKYPEMEYIKTELLENITDSTMRFGAQILKKEDYTYIFGKKDTLINEFKYPVPMLARVSESVSDPWEFYAGDDTWSFDCKDAQPIGDRPMSESFFVYEKNNKFYLIMHEIWNVGELYILESDKITGPWNRSSSGGIENLFCLIPKHGNNFTYNLFAHPHFQHNEKILISFNVNTSDFNSIYTDTRNYRARFLWVSAEEAVSTSTPYTVRIFEDFTDISNSNRDLEDKNENPYLEIYASNVHVKNINSESILSIINLDGKVLYFRNIKNDITVSLTDFPDRILIVKLLNNNTVCTKKVIKTY